LGQLTADGLEALPTLFQVLLNAAMQIEWQKHLEAAPHERTEERTGHVNSYKDKTLNTPLGQFTVAVPQVREVNRQGDGTCQGWVITEVFDNALLSLLDKVVSCLEKERQPTASCIRKQFSATWRRPCVGARGHNQKGRAQCARPF